MVWGLLPVEPLSGEDKYYIFKKGTYKVGRKGCDVIINKDKGVSRVHAEIAVAAMNSSTTLQNGSTNVSSTVCLRDCSKYGTFINKNLESKRKVHEFPNKETTINDGDLISFGTGNATYSRFCYVPLVFYCTKSCRINRHLQDKISSIGASVVHNLNQECTHVLVRQQMELKEDLIDAVVARKPFVLESWVEFVAEKSIRTEIPSCSSNLSTLAVEGTSIEVADPRTCDKCLEGYTFVLDSTEMYRFRDRLLSLLEVGGARIYSIEEFCSSSQELDYGENNQVAFVMPRELSESTDSLKKISSLRRVNEADLICAVLSGKVDHSKFVLPPVLVSSSCSTDETVVADSDLEEETARSAHANSAVTVETTAMNERKEAILVKEPAIHESEETITEEISATGNKNGGSRYCDITRSDDSHATDFRHSNAGSSGRREKCNEYEGKYSDVIFSQGLLVRNLDLPATVSCTARTGVLNFKRFRKMNSQSGNSFGNLIPFSKYPYTGSDYEGETAEAVKEEKKRKEMEAMSDDLFNNTKGKQRGASRSLRGFLSRSWKRQGCGMIGFCNAPM